MSHNNWLGIKCMGFTVCTLKRLVAYANQTLLCVPFSSSVRFSKQEKTSQVSYANQLATKLYSKVYIYHTMFR